MVSVNRLYSCRKTALRWWTFCPNFWKLAFTFERERASRSWSPGLDLAEGRSWEFRPSSWPPTGADSAAGAPLLGRSTWAFPDLRLPAGPPAQAPHVPGALPDHSLLRARCFLYSTWVLRPPTCLVINKKEKAVFLHEVTCLLFRWFLRLSVLWNELVSRVNHAKPGVLWFWFGLM